MDKPEEADLLTEQTVPLLYQSEDHDYFEEATNKAIKRKVGTHDHDEETNLTSSKNHQKMKFNTLSKYSPPSGTKYIRRMITILYITVLLLLVFALAVFYAFYHYNLAVETETATTKYLENDNLSDTRPIHNVLLIGDSLFNRPYEFWNFGGKLHDALLPNYRLNIINHARDSQQIHKIAFYLLEDLSCQPDTVLLYWDSDISGVEENLMNETELAVNRQTYVEHLTYVINTVKYNSTAKYFSISGPGMFGEAKKPFIKIPFLNEHDKFHSKDKMVEEYRELNRQIATDFNVTYVDMRSIFLKNIPSWWFMARYYATTDGEHPNRYGTKLLVDVYGKLLQNWYENDI